MLSMQDNPMTIAGKKASRDVAKDAARKSPHGRFERTFSAYLLI
jgi:hypothetical protein